MFCNAGLVLRKVIQSGTRYIRAAENTLRCWLLELKWYRTSTTYSIILGCYDGSGQCCVRLNTSALVGDPDPYPRVFQIQNAIPGSMQVSATRWLGAVSQKLVGSRVLVGPQVLGSTYKYLQVLRILNINKVVNCKYKCMLNKILLRHGVTLWWNQIWLDRLHVSYHQSPLSLTWTPTSKTL